MIPTIDSRIIPGCHQMIPSGKSTKTVKCGGMMMKHKKKVQDPTCAQCGFKRLHQIPACNVPHNPK